MWSQPKHRHVDGTARPLRVAYLVDIDDCPDLLLDEIFAECFSRWGGRRTPVIPATVDGICSSYAKWLEVYDADVIYSFVDLDQAAVSAIHERYAPGFLHRHENRTLERNSHHRFEIELPIRGLSSLSVLPMFASRHWGLDEKPEKIITFDKYWDGVDDAFLRENFGFLSSSFSNLQLGTSAPALFSTMTLISKEGLADPHSWKSPHSEYVVTPNALLEVDLSRFDAAPLIAFTATKETDYGTETDE